MSNTNYFPVRNVVISVIGLGIKSFPDDAFCLVTFNLLATSVFQKIFLLDYFVDK